MTNLQEALHQHSFWQNSDPDFQNLLLECAEIERFYAGQVIFERDDDADSFYLIHSGEVALSTPLSPGHGMMVTQVLKEGEALGWSWLFPPHKWHFNAVAMIPTDVIKFRGETLRSAARNNPVLGYRLAMRVGNMMLERLQSTRMRLAKILQPA